MNTVAINSTKFCCTNHNSLFSKFKVKKQLLLLLAFLFLGTFLSFSQTTGSCSPSNNPEFPSECDACIIVVLDESGSITSGQNNIESQVVTALKDFVEVLNDPCLDVSMAIVEYSSLARPAQIGSSTGFQVINNTYETNLNNYLTGSGSTSSNPTYYSPGGGTNWDQGLRQAKILADNAPCDNPYIVMFSDGNPTYYGTGPSGPGSSTTTAVLEAACEAANELKASGRRIFTVALPNPSVVTLNVEAITDGASSLEFVDSSPGIGETSNIRLADYLITTQADVGDAFAALAAGIAAPTISTNGVSGLIDGFCPTITAPTFTVNHDCQNNATPIVVDSGVSINGCEATQSWTASYAHTGVCPAVADDLVITYTWFQDNEDPVITDCPNPIALGEDPLPGDLPTVLDAENEVTASDNCGVKSKIATAGSIEIDGCNRTQIFNVVVTDNCDRTAECEVTYSWSENCCVPAATCNLADIDNEGCDIPVALTDPIAVFSGIESCGAAITMNHADVGDKDVCGDGDGADFVRTYTLFFDSVEFASCEQNIIIKDTTPPVISGFEASITVQCDDIPVADLATIPDNCGTAVVNAVDSGFSGGCQGTIERTYTATDECGNTSEFIQILNIVDTEDPTFNSEPSVLADISCSAALPVQETLTATDNCGSATVVPSVDSYTVDVCNGYAVTYRWTATDACTNSSEKSVTFNVLPDTTAPILEEPSAISDISCSDTLPTQETLTATDDCGVATVVPSVDSYTVDVCNGYAVTYRWTATDGCTNSSEKSVTFNVLPSPELILTDVANEIYDSCDYETQAEVDSAFQVFLNKFGYSGGCDATGQLASAYSAPDLCAGGEVSVTYDVTDLCEDKSETASFTITPSTDLEVSCPTAVNLGSSSTQQEISDAYDAWKLEFTKTGGCEATDNLGTFPSLPDFNCGTAVNLNFTYIATDRCNPNGVSCSSTFVVPGVTPLTITCPDNVFLPACSSEAEIVAAIEIWLAEFSVNGGDNPTSNFESIENFDVQELYNTYFDGDCPDNAFAIRLVASDSCNPPGELECIPIFSVLDADELELSPKPTDITTLACEDPSVKFDQWILDLQAMTVSGGCEAEVEYSVDLNTLSVDGYCDSTAQILTVDINAKDGCGETVPVTATFTVPAYSNDLVLVGDCPTNNEVDGCSTDAEILAIFNAWKAGVLTNFSATGGCNAEVNYSTDVSALQAPTQCGTADQIVSVDIKATDDCGETSITTCSFIAKAFDSTLEITEVADESYDSCDYATQTEVDAAFQVFLNKFGYTGGCDASGQLVSAYSAPELMCWRRSKCNI